MMNCKTGFKILGTNQKKRSVKRIYSENLKHFKDGKKAKAVDNSWYLNKTYYL